MQLIFMSESKLLRGLDTLIYTGLLTLHDGQGDCWRRPRPRYILNICCVCITSIVLLAWLGFYRLHILGMILTRSWYRQSLLFGYRWSRSQCLLHWVRRMLSNINDYLQILAFFQWLRKISTKFLIQSNLQANESLYYFG